jgi:excisionase family DNA binding protein
MTGQVDELMTIREAARILKVHPSTLRNWDRVGRLNAVRVGSRRDRRFKRADISAMAEAQQPGEGSTAKESKQLPNREITQMAWISQLGKELAGAQALREVVASYASTIKALSPMWGVEDALKDQLRFPSLRELLEPTLLKDQLRFPDLRELLESTLLKDQLRFPDLHELLEATLLKDQLRFPGLRELLEPTLWEHKSLTRRITEYLSSAFEGEGSLSAAYARLAATQADLSCTQAITSLAASMGQIASQVTEQIRANIGSFQELSHAVLWDLGDTVAPGGKRLPFAELKLAGGLLQSATTLVTDFRTEPGDAPPAVARKPNLFQYFHREARQILAPDNLSDVELEARLRAAKSLRAGNMGLAIVEAWSRVNRTAQLSARDPVFESSVDAVTIAARLPLFCAESESELGEVADSLFKLVVEASGKGRRLRAAVESSEYETVEDIVILRNYYRHDLSQGQSHRDSRRQFGRVGNVFQRLSGKPYPSSPADWQRTSLTLMRRVRAFLTALADKLEGAG